MLTGGMELLRRYGSVFRTSWMARKENDAPLRLRHEAAFLPAHLEIMETPVHPAPRWSARVVVILALSVLALVTFGRLDIVAVAPGRLIPNARVKVIQPAITGVVRQIFVQDGMHVRAGQVLIQLNPKQAEADTNKAREARLDAELTIARAQALLSSQLKGTPPSVALVADAPLDRQTQTQDDATGLFHEYRAKIGSLHAELAKREAQLTTTQAEIAKFRQTAPLAQQVAGDYRALVPGKYVAQQDFLEKEQQAISATEDLAAQTSRAHELQAAIEEQRSDIQTTVAVFRQHQLDDLGKAQEVLSQATYDQTKAQVRQALMTLVAPVSGTVQQLAVHTVGGVVTTAQKLLEIVPNDSLEAEAHLANKDIGFVRAGQRAVVKIDAFPYTRYGYLTGTVEEVSDDAVSDGKGKWYFVVRIKLPGRTFRIGTRTVNLTPGMDVSTEIHTGSRSVADYFLSPLKVLASESLRER